MTSPTREEIQTAYDALETLTNTCIHSGDLAEELQELVLRVLPPKPLPTMADVEWDDDLHFLAGATTPIGREAVMLWHDDVESGNIITTTGEWRRDQLTPTGKRYMLTEVQA